ncbi:unnamed protein product [Periconia digitata]|uniref:Uncharacterized protein n=1 Tax=Periconia digitata TaxID=1303443 RepID=A0A9W4UGQ8_9PLEO|nr:unnamed protein product [Periconia digitata]
MHVVPIFRNSKGLLLPRGSRAPRSHLWRIVFKVYAVALATLCSAFSCQWMGGFGPRRSPPTDPPVPSRGMDQCHDAFCLPSSQRQV